MSKQEILVVPDVHGNLSKLRSLNDPPRRAKSSNHSQILSAEGKDSNRTIKPSEALARRVRFMPLKQQSKPPASSAVTRSVSFWLTLFAALGLYGLAVLAPKLAGREELLSNYHAQQIQLLRDEQKLTRLRQVAVSLQRDSEFVEELLRRDLQATQYGEEIIPLEGNLVYRETDPVPPSAVRNPPWYASFLAVVGGSPDLRGVLLLSAVVMILFAFGFLQLPESSNERSEQDDFREIPPKPTLLTKWLARYDRSAEEQKRRGLLARLARLESEADWEKDALPIDAFDEEEF